MIVECPKCRRVYNDTHRWTYCPHDKFGFPPAEPFPRIARPAAAAAEEPADDTIGVALDELEALRTRPMTSFTQAEADKYMRTVAMLLEAMLPLGPSAKGKAFFFLLVCDSQEKGQSHYVSNAARDNAADMLRETAFRLERPPGDHHQPKRSDQ